MKHEDIMRKRGNQEARRYARKNGSEVFGINGEPIELWRRKDERARAPLLLILFAVLVALALLFEAFVWGYTLGIDAEIERQRIYQRESAEQDARIMREVRAMTNHELIAATKSVANINTNN